jgi:hypothetical protein
MLRLWNASLGVPFCSERVEVPPEGADLEQTLVFPPGESTIRLSPLAEPVPAPAGASTGYVKLVGWRLSPPVP